jgi:hypothetical protein
MSIGLERSHHYQRINGGLINVYPLRRGAWNLTRVAAGSSTVAQATDSRDRVSCLAASPCNRCQNPDQADRVRRYDLGAGIKGGLHARVIACAGFDRVGICQRPDEISAAYEFLNVMKTGLCELNHIGCSLILLRHL